MFGMLGLAKFKKSYYQNGNVLFLILIAVALFAALCYAVSTSSRSGDGSIVSKEKSRADAAAIVQFGAAMQAAMLRMRISNSCSDTSYDFSNLVYKKNTGAVANSANATAPTSKMCHLFSASGGGIVPYVPPVTALDSKNPLAGNSGEPILGHGTIRIRQIQGIGTDDLAGTESANDIIFLQDWISRETCLTINDTLEIDNPSGEPPNAPFTTGSNSGSYINGSLAGDWIMNDAQVAGQSAFCANLRALPNHDYVFIQVIYAR